MHTQDIIEQFRTAMLDAGIGYTGTIHPDTTEIQRFHVDGDKSKTTNGWYILHTDGIPAGEFGSWKSGQSVTWCAKNTTEITQADRAEIQARAERNKKLREQAEKTRHDEASETALMIWDAATPCDTHPYLTRKNVKSHGLRVGKWPYGETVINDALLIPIKDGQKITSLQAIFPSSDNPIGRDKTFLSGGKKRGCLFAIGKPDESLPDLKIAIAEGYSTGATIHDATGWPVVIAFDAGNLPTVTEKIRKRYPSANIVICADNDQYGETNTGVTYAEKAAKENNAWVAIPQFTDTTSKPTDFNDLMHLSGLTSVHLQIARDMQPPVITHTHVDTETGEVTEITQQGVDFISPLPDISGSNKPLSTIENLAEICRRLNFTIRYNVIKKEEEIIIPNESFTIDNEANASLAVLMSWAGRFRFPTGQIGDFVTYLADKNIYNPVVNWITSKPWDGISRLPELYATLTVENENDDDPIYRDLKEVMLRRWLISAVAAAFNYNGVSAHGVLVLQGAQSLGKTAWFKSLVPSNLNVIADGLILKPDDKDSVKQAVSNWLVELGELDATFRKADIAQLKSFLTKDRDTLRRAYARRESTFARRTVFFASVNPREFLHDATGNRRYWTLSCIYINHKHNIDTQQLWAEMHQLYLNGEPWILQPHEMDALNQSNKDFETCDPIQERLQSHLNWDAPKSQWTWKSATEILIMVGIDRPSHADSTKCSQMMRELNGAQFKRVKGTRVLYCPPKINLNAF